MDQRTLQALEMGKCREAFVKMSFNDLGAVYVEIKKQLNFIKILGCRLVKPTCPGSQEFGKAINLLEKNEEDMAVLHAYKASTELHTALNKKEYELESCDFLILTLTGLLGFRYGLYSLVESNLQHDLILKKSSKLFMFCARKMDTFQTIVGSCSGQKNRRFLQNMAETWLPLKYYLEKISSDEALENYKNLYEKLAAKNEPTEEVKNLKYCAMEEINRYVFVHLLGLIEKGINIGDSYLKLEGALAETVQTELRSHSKYLDKVDKNDLAYFGLLFYTISGVAFQIFDDYVEAKRAFNNIRDIRARLQEPFVALVNQFDFTKLESICEKKVKDVAVEDVVEDVEVTAPGKRPKGKKGKKGKNKLPQIITKNEERAVADEKNVPHVQGDEAGEVQGDVPHVQGDEAGEVQGDEAGDQTEPHVEGAGDDEKTEPHVEGAGSNEQNVEQVLSIHTGFIRIPSKEFLSEIENDLAFVDIRRSRSCEIDGRSEFLMGDTIETLVRYRDLLKASKEMEIMEKVDREYPDARSFILQPKSPLYAYQTVSSDGCEICVYYYTVEHAIPIHRWLEECREKFMRQHQTEEKPSRAAWWNFIKDDFKQIFRGIIRGLWILSSVGCCGLGRRMNQCGIFVCNSNGRIKPFVDDDNTVLANGNTSDIKRLRDIYSFVLKYHCQPDDCPKVSVNDFPSIYDEFHSQIGPIKDKILYYSSEMWYTSFLIECPFFWTRQERVNFLFKFGNLLDRKQVCCYVSFDILIDFKKDWQMIIESLECSTGEEAVLYKIYQRDLVTYKRSIDVVRYCVNVLKHYNGYSICPKILKHTEIEDLLRKQIPDLYVVLVKAIIRGVCRDDILPEVTVFDDSEVFMTELLTKTFGKGQCDHGCSPHMVCLH